MVKNTIRLVFSIKEIAYGAEDKAFIEKVAERLKAQGVEEASNVYVALLPKKEAVYRFIERMEGDRETLKRLKDIFNTYYNSVVEWVEQFKGKVAEAMGGTLQWTAHLEEEEAVPFFLPSFLFGMVVDEKSPAFPITNRSAHTLAKLLLYSFWMGAQKAGDVPPWEEVEKAFLAEWQDYKRASSSFADFLLALTDAGAGILKVMATSSFLSGRGHPIAAEIEKSLSERLKNLMAAYKGYVEAAAAALPISFLYSLVAPEKNMERYLPKLSPLLIPLFKQFKEASLKAYRAWVEEKSEEGAVLFIVHPELVEEAAQWASVSEEGLREGLLA